MNRPIEFRGKSKDGVWIYGDLSTKYTGEHYIVCNIETGVTFWHNVYPETVGQYTGLQDKNGKKIFEGDIVTVDHKKENYRHGNQLGFKSQVFYEKASFNVNSYDGWEMDNLTGYVEYWDVVVIGNIYENPELLEARND